MKRVKKWLNRLSIFTLLTVVAGSLALIALPKPSLLEEIPFSQRVYDRNHQLLRLALTDDDKYRVFAPLEKIAPSMVEATLLHEDRYFYSHYGVNPVALTRAFWNAVSGRGPRLGASTITMQLARVRFHLKTRTYWGKLAQITRTAQL